MEKPMIINLSKGKSTTVSPQDFDYLNKFKWYYMGGNRNNYAARREYHTRKLIFMHRLILERQGIVLKKLQVDHINRNGLDNRRENLRTATPGYFADKVKAAIAYNITAKKYFSNYANINLI